MKLEKLEDLLTVDTATNKADANKKLLLQIKQLIKKENKKEASNEVLADSLPYEAISVVGSKYVTVKFDIATKQAVVSNIEHDSRDVGVKNYMAVYHATNKLRLLGKNQKEES